MKIVSKISKHYVVSKKDDNLWKKFQKNVTFFYYIEMQDDAKYTDQVCTKKKFEKKITNFLVVISSSANFFLCRALDMVLNNT